MSEEIQQAFAHPEERAKALASGDPLDRISLRDHIVAVEIGAFQAERDMTQRISFNVVVEVYPQGDDVDDDVDRILSYDRVTEAIDTELAVERLALLETLAARVAERILLEPQAARVFVRIEKLDRGAGALGVEIVRSKGQGDAARLDAQDGPPPQLVYLSNAAITSPHLSRWLDQLEGQAAPLILCVGAPQGTLPRASDPKAQHRIDLLAVEQNAWALAATDSRCTVVGTRTELDWHMKNGLTCIWAPAKMVLDAVPPPPADAQNAVALAAWFAGQCGAPELLVIGAEAPEKAAVAVRLHDLGEANL